MAAYCKAQSQKELELCTNTKRSDRLKNVRPHDIGLGLQMSECELMIFIYIHMERYRNEYRHVCVCVCLHLYIYSCVWVYLWVCVSVCLCTLPRNSEERGLERFANRGQLKWGNTVDSGYLIPEPSFKVISLCE